jgi:hypothetical protein
MYPAGHARSQIVWSPILQEKFRRLAALGGVNAEVIERQLAGLRTMTPGEVRDLYSFKRSEAEGR